MNKNTVLALLICGAIFFGFNWWNSKQNEERMVAARAEQAVQDSIMRANAPVVSAAEQIAIKAQQDSLALALKSASLGGFASAISGTDSLTVLENDLAVYTFSNKGARLVSVELKDYQRLNTANLDQRVKLFDPVGSNFGYAFFAPNLVNTNELYFRVHSTTQNEVTYRLYADSTTFAQFTYVIAGDNYMLDFAADFSRLSGLMAGRQTGISLGWSAVSPQEEKGYSNENNYTTLSYRLENGSVDDLGISTSTKREQLAEPVQWVAFKQQFFSSILVAQNAPFTTANLEYKTMPEGSGSIKDFSAQLTENYDPAAGSVYAYKMYFGPNQYSILEEYGADYSFEELVPLGWWIFGAVNRYIVIPVFNLLNSWIASFGLIILLLTLIIKLLILPLTYKSYLSTAKMRLLGPEIKEIADKYPKREDAMKKQQATMALYKRAGVSPLGGCIPMLIQLPILFAMFRFFPSAIELRGQSFLWSTDLSSYDSIIDLPFSIPFYGDHVSLWTILMAVSLFVLQKINMGQNSAMQSQQMPGMKFMMLYMMPVMLLFIFNNYSSGLAYYYFLSNIITIGQTYAFRTFVDDKALHDRMKENAKKPVKKSKWAERLEEMQRQQNLRNQGR